MAIYRGAGGAGDATGDSASEALLVRDLATQVTADAAAAEAARVAAVAAKVAAETAETNAETAETNAETAETNAETAQAAAASSASAASTSATNAASSASSASTSATNASNSATAAAGSASAASTSATNAASSASSASTSASTATTQATNAANSASAAATSATNASNSASAAATSASNAATSATSASNSASTATTQATNAANSATAAATSATNSANSATASASSATDSAASATLANDWATKTSAPVAGGEYSAKYHAQQASTSATNASNSASSAATSATNASNSATASASSASDAAASAAAAAASYDNFDDRYLGSKSSAPTLDNDGNALLTGALYYNNGTVTPANKGMYVYDGSQWIAASAASTAILTIYKFTATAGQTTFSGNDDNAVSLVYTAGSVIITLNGVVLEIPSEVTASSGTSVVLSTGAVAGDELNIYAFATFNVANTYTQAQSDATFLTKSNPSYTGTLTGGTGVVNIGSGQVYKDASGNVGIGTSSPANLLSIGAGSFASATSQTTGMYTNGTSGLVALSDAYSFNSRTGSGFMTINSSGNVGIGTSSPARRLDVRGTLGMQVNEDGAGTKVISMRSDFAGAGPAINVTTNDPLLFLTNNTERMRIDSSGNLLVARTSTFSTPGGDTPKIYSAGALGVISGSTVSAYSSDRINFNASTYYVLGSSTGGGVKLDNGTTAWAAQSDETTKDIIEPISNGIGKVNNIRAVIGKYKEDVEGTRRSFLIAQDVQAVLPEAVSTSSDGLLSLRYTEVIPLLVAAIQELKAEVDSLKSEVTALKGQA